MVPLITHGMEVLYVTFTQLLDSYVTLFYNKRVLQDVKRPPWVCITLFAFLNVFRIKFLKKNSQTFCPKSRFLETIDANLWSTSLWERGGHSCSAEPLVPQEASGVVLVWNLAGWRAKKSQCLSLCSGAGNGFCPFRTQTGERVSSSSWEPQWFCFILASKFPL